MTVSPAPAGVLGVFFSAKTDLAPYLDEGGGWEEIGSSTLASNSFKTSWELLFIGAFCWRTDKDLFIPIEFDGAKSVYNNSVI